MTDRPPIRRRWRNYLLDAHLQLRFASWSVSAALLVSGVFGFFLWSSGRELFAQVDEAVQARSRAADTSRELGNAALGAELMQHFDDPAFAQKMKARSEDIDRQFQKEMALVVSQREDLVRRQHTFTVGMMTVLAGFVLAILLFSIVLSHRVAGPLFRMRRIFTQLAEGKIELPSYGLRDRDELKEEFDQLVEALKALKNQRSRVQDLSSRAEQLVREGRSSAEVLAALEALRREVEGG